MAIDLPGASRDRAELRLLNYRSLWIEGLMRLVDAEDRLGTTEETVVMTNPAYRRVLRELARRDALPQHLPEGAPG